MFDDLEDGSSLGLWVAAALLILLLLGIGGGWWAQQHREAASVQAPGVQPAAPHQQAEHTLAAQVPARLAAANPAPFESSLPLLPDAARGP